jgi:iron complex transport system substrate-binding protein
MNSARTLKNEQVKARIKSGRILQIGQEGNFDRELIIAAQPQVIFVSPSKRGGYDVLGDVQVPLIPYMGYKEATALGQAEWIKFVALFTGQEKEAETWFNALVSRYETLRHKTDSVTTRPVVMNGRMIEGSWCAEGGRSVLTQMIGDAGARYVLSDNQATSDIKMEFEEYYAKAANADYWTILNSQDGFDYAALRADDARYEDFRAFRERHVVYCNIKASALRELSPMHPDLLLADLIHAFHPESSDSTYQPTFYHLLKK